MDITNFDLSFRPRRSERGSYVRDFLAGLLFRAPGARHKHTAHGPVAGLTMDGHMLRDLGLTRHGMREDSIANHNEAG